MNQNQNFLKWIKLGIYAVASIFAVYIIWQSKKFFENNYNKHEILESDVDLYKVENSDKAPEQEQTNIQIMEERPIEIHDEVTSIIVPQNGLTESKDANLEKNNTAEGVTKAQEPSGREMKPIVNNNVHEAKPQSKTMEKKKTSKKNLKPKTLEKHEPVSKSVLKNPLFQSYVVQVGAFSILKDAKQYQQNILKIKSISAYRTDISSKNNIHKVFIGYFESHPSAENICTTLKNENVQCFVTKL